MITDRMEYRLNYCGMDSRLDRILDIMADYTPDRCPTGQLALDGEELFLIFASYQTHSAEAAVMEAHRRYVDIMYMVEGEEYVYVKPTQELCTIIAEYDPEKDAILAKMDEDAAKVYLKAGQFLVLFPQDAHAPGCHSAGTSAVKKIIGKMRVK